MNDTYHALSIFIGVVLVIDGILLKKANGKCTDNTLLSITTNIEFLWVVMSALALTVLNFSGWAFLIPVAYVAHNILGWLYGVLIMTRRKESISNKQFYVPLWYVNFGLTFGVIFALANLAAIFA